MFSRQSLFDSWERCAFGVRPTSVAAVCRNNKADSVTLQKAEKGKIEIDTEGG